MQARRFGSRLRSPKVMSPKPDAGLSLDHMSTVQDRDQATKSRYDRLRPV